MAKCNYGMDHDGDAKVSKGKGDPKNTYGDDTKKPPLGKGDPGGKVMSKGAAAKKASAGDDMGKPGKQFGKIAAKAGKEYGSKKQGEAVAGAIFQKQRKAGKL